MRTKSIFILAIAVVVLLASGGLAITATAKDPDGNSSELSAPKTVVQR